MHKQAVTCPVTPSQLQDRLGWGFRAGGVGGVGVYLSQRSQQTTRAWSAAARAGCRSRRSYWAPAAGGRWSPPVRVRQDRTWAHLQPKPEHCPHLNPKLCGMLRVFYLFVDSTACFYSHRGRRLSMRAYGVQRLLACVKKCPFFRQNLKNDRRLLGDSSGHRDTSLYEAALIFVLTLVALSFFSYCNFWSSRCSTLSLSILSSLIKF